MMEVFIFLFFASSSNNHVDKSLEYYNFVIYS